MVWGGVMLWGEGDVMREGLMVWDSGKVSRL